MLASADAHYRRQAELAVLALRAARRAWAQVPAADIAAWEVLAGPLAATITTVQLAAAIDAAAYIPAALLEQGTPAAASAELVPSAFAGVASDGRALSSLLDQPRIHVLTRIGQGMAPPLALESGRVALEAIAVTQVQDAGRGAEGVAIVTREHVTGYIRQVSPPSACSRCAILAGQFYRWNKGFLRHPRCRCRHVPIMTTEAYRDQRTEPSEYFRSLSRPDQDRTFTKAGAQAIRDGADPAAVVNARRKDALYTAGGRLMTRESTTRRGLAARPGRARAMPETIYEAAGGDRAEALRLLQLHGYLR